MTSDINDVDVFISGCGPVGLWFGYLMARRGHSIYIADKKSGPTSQSRALLITARVLEIFESEHIVHHILKNAYLAGGNQLFWGTTAIGTADVPQDAIYPQLTLVPQGTTETIIKGLLEKMTTIHWNTELVSYKQEKDHVLATVRDDQGEKLVKAKYIIGADGCHSIVRKQGQDWTYEGYSVATLFSMADVALAGPDLEKMQHRLTVSYNSKGLCGAIPLGPLMEDSRQYFRIIMNMGPYEESSPDAARPSHGIIDREPMNLEEIQKIMHDRMTGFNISASDPIWSSYFKINERKANGFRRNRAFVMGDAAHCHSPVGGQGMNLGIMDGQSSDPEKLLDSYSTEREPPVEQTMRSTGNATRTAFLGGYWMDVVRYLGLRLVFAIPRVRDYGMRLLMQIDLALGASPILGSSSSGLLAAGHYLPDTTVLRRRIITEDQSGMIYKSLHQILHQSTRHTALFVVTRPPHCLPNKLITAFWDKILPYRTSVRPLIVESAWHASDHRMPQGIDPAIEDPTDAYWIEGRSDGSDSISVKIGLQPHFSGSNPPAALILVRPDRYVAHSMLINSSSDIDKAISFFDTYLSKQ
ncbi:hypothetical protein EC973_005114 [Apophysomyces ossiformis]|uniref:FAD-binding domain-containing protein n=1 Tax=Apophysomyces ossiformis TaxID=679940 RepID=A0A8H7BKL0_9FUNG|nr:hypothetical protein EC973_005114 [Apophysomyces ossiformis]